jgi:hypothetical protein
MGYQSEHFANGENAVSRWFEKKTSVSAVVATSASLVGAHRRPKTTAQPLGI